MFSWVGDSNGRGAGGVAGRGRGVWLALALCTVLLTPAQVDGQCTPGGSAAFSLLSGGAFCRLVTQGPLSCIATRGPYGNNERCTFCVRQDVRLYTSSFDVENGGATCYDYLQIGNGVGAPEYCGQSGPNGVAVSAGTTLTWSTDTSVTRNGFVVCNGSIASTPPPTPATTAVCGVAATLPDAPLSLLPSLSPPGTSPRPPPPPRPPACIVDPLDGCVYSNLSTFGRYQGNALCTICVSVDTEITTAILGTEPDPTCSNDYLQFGSQGQRYCGTNPPPQNITMSAGSIIIWRTDSNDNQYDGFRICATANLSPTLPPTNPSGFLSFQPTAEPTRLPSSHQPTQQPYQPTSVPTSRQPTRPVTRAPSRPTRSPSREPTRRPTRLPSTVPTRSPRSISPTSAPFVPSLAPSEAPVSASPVAGAPVAPTFAPFAVTTAPVATPTESPVAGPPSTVSPVPAVTVAPVAAPTISPSGTPTTIAPSTSTPTVAPTGAPSAATTGSPSATTAPALATTAAPNPPPPAPGSGDASSGASSSGDGAFLYVIIGLILIIVIVVAVVVARRRGDNKPGRTRPPQANPQYGTSQLMTNPAYPGDARRGAPPLAFASARSTGEPPSQGPRPANAPSGARPAGSVQPVYATPDPVDSGAAATAPGIGDGYYGFSGAGHVQQPTYVVPEDVPPGGQRGPVYATTSPLASPGTKQVGEHAYEVKYAVNEQAALERGGVTVHDGMSHVQPDYEVALPHGRQPSGPLRGEMEPAVAGGPADYVAPSAVGSRKQSLQDDLYAIPDGGFEA